MPNLLQKYILIVGSIVLLTFSGNAQSKSSSSNSRATRIKKAQQRNDALVKAQNNGYKYLAPINKTYSDKKPGFMIITTEELKQNIKNLPKYVYIKHKVRNFRVFMATAKDWNGLCPIADQVRDEAKKILPKIKNNVESYRTTDTPSDWDAGKLKKHNKFLLKKYSAEVDKKGRYASLNILKFLKQNYKKLNLKYVIFIGGPRPESGTTPMLRSDPWYSATDYPYADLDYNWQEPWEKMKNRKAGGDERKELGLLKSWYDKTGSHHPEVFVGRIPYYGEESEYGKITDMEIILDRFIRYDTEKDINYRYSMLVDKTTFHKEFEKIGFNYKTVDRWKWPIEYGMPAIGNSRNPANRHISNFQKLQDYSTVLMGAYSHGGPWGMEGLHISYVKSAHDKYPSVITLGACSVGDIMYNNNLTYTLLRFQAIAASGGTQSVSNYNGDHEYVKKNKLGKSHTILKGGSVGEAHWGWYGHLAKGGPGKVAATNLSINLYGDPSLVPMRYGAKPPYPFIAKPVQGFFHSVPTENDYAKIKESIIVSNNRKTPVTVTVDSGQSWLMVSSKSITLQPNEKKVLKLKPRPNFYQRLEDGYNEALITLSATTKHKTLYSCTRRFVLKKNYKGIHLMHTFDKGAKNIKNFSDFKSNRTAVLSLLDEKSASRSPVKPLKDPKENVSGRFGQGFDTNYLNRGSVCSFEKDDMGIAFFTKFNSKAQGSQSQKIFGFGDTLDISRTATGISFELQSIAVNPLTKESITPAKTLGKANFDWQNDKWYHIAFDLDQQKGVARLYINGKNLCSGKIKPAQTYHSPTFQLPPCDNIIDDFVIQAKTFSKSQLKRLYSGNYVVDMQPNENTLDNENVNFTFNSGLDTKNFTVQLLGNGQNETIKANEKGQFTVPKLSSGQKYYWQVADKTGKACSPRRFFYTYTHLLNVDKNFSKVRNSITGDYKFAEKMVSVVAQKAVYIKADAKLTAKTYYKFDFSGHVQSSKHAVLGIYVKTSNGKMVPLKTRKIYQNKAYRWELNATVDYPCSALNKYIGLPIYVGFESVEGSKGGFMKAKLSSTPTKGMNFAPQLLKPADLLKYNVKVKQTGFCVVLSKLVRDPDKDHVTYTLLRGPRWAYIQNNESLFSNFGPPASNLGESFDCEIEAKDSKGNRTKFTINLKVIR